MPQEARLSIWSNITVYFFFSLRMHTSTREVVNIETFSDIFHAWDMRCVPYLTLCFQTVFALPLDIKYVNQWILYSFLDIYFEWGFSVPTYSIGIVGVLFFLKTCHLFNWKSITNTYSEWPTYLMNVHFDEQKEVVMWSIGTINSFKTDLFSTKLWKYIIQLLFARFRNTKIILLK